ncbi:SCO7613 C-terminal domain-containing membrane protein [Embleya sp. NPDC127516]|uniref:SCO7613 C-terminal domain-containing membrane protein n=1 Tax=Embleya sp. NPDC127516 TaxID=3363990 RepID=UPI003809DE03
MLNERLLDDATRCPGCARELGIPRTDRCHRCAIRLSGPEADRLWQVNVSAAQLLRQREALLQAMRAEAHRALTRPPLAPPATQPSAPAPPPTQTQTQTQTPVSQPVPTQPPAARLREMAEVGRRRVARIVLGAGVLLVVLAALVFVAVTWNRTGTGGRALVMALALVMAAAGTAVAERRELPATAEAMAALTVAMGLLDGYAAWAADLAGLRDGSAVLVAAGTMLAVGGAAALGSMVAPLRALRVSAAVLLQGPLPLLIAWFGVGRSSLLPLAVGLGLQAAVDVALLSRVYARAARGLRIVTEVGVLCYWLAAVVLTFVEGPSGPAAATMLGLAAIAGGIAFTLRRSPAVRHLASGSAMAGSLAAVALLVATRPADDSDLPIAWAGVGLLIVVLVAMAPLFAVPRAFRAGPLAVLAPLTAAPAFWVIATPVMALVGPLSWPARAWSIDSAGVGARNAILPDGDWDFGLAPLVLLPLTLPVALAAVTLLRGRPGRTPTLVAGAVVVEGLLLVLPPALDLPLWAALGWHLVAAGGWALTGRVRPWLPLVALAHGIVALTWATAHPLTSITVWALGAAGLTLTAVLSPGRLSPEPNRATAEAAPETNADTNADATSDPRPSDRAATHQSNNHRSPAPEDSTNNPFTPPQDRLAGDRAAADDHPGSDHPHTADHRPRPTPALLDPLVRPIAAGLALAVACTDAAMAAHHAGAAKAPTGLVSALLCALVTLIAVALRPKAATTRALTLVGGAGWAIGLLAAAHAPVPLAVGLAAALPTCLVGALRDLPTTRPAWAGAACVWWVGAIAAGAHAFGADRPGTAQAAVIAAAVLFPLATVPASRPAVALAIEGTAGAALLVALLVGRTTSPVTFAIAAGATLCGALFGRTALRPGWAPATAVLLYATTAATLYRLDVGVPGQAVAGACAAAILLVVATYLHDLPMAALTIEGVAMVAALVSIAQSGGLLPVALAVVTAGTLHSAIRGHGEARPIWAPATVALFTATVPATLHRLDAAPTVSVLVAVGTAALLYVTTARLPRSDAAAGLATALVAACCVLMAAVATLVVAPEQIWLALAAAGSAAATTPDGPLRRSARPTAIALLFAAYWVRLALLGVTHREAYTIPLGLALLAEGFLRRRADPETTSWTGYGAPLAVLLLPSLPLALSQGEPIRPGLLGAAAIATLLVGARFRLQAPLFLGAAVLATVGLVHLLPHLAPVYDAVPRWAVLGTAGVLLIVIGAGYERRLRDLKRLRRAVGRLG